MAKLDNFKKLIEMENLLDLKNKSNLFPSNGHIPAFVRHSKHYYLFGETAKNMNTSIFKDAFCYQLVIKT